MGTSMESIQNAYQGFAKQNYTMLDNLKLGYGGTKEEMARLVQDAAALSDTVDAQSLSFANIVEAIHVVQTNLGITGTTALEASTTISGSLNSMKSAWSNLITGIADDQADFDTLIGNMVDSVGTFAGNITPRIEVALNGAADLIGQLFPIIVDKIPSIVSTVFPKLIKSGVQIIQSLIQGISKNAKLLTNSALEVISTLSTGILEMLPDIIALGLDLLVALATGIVEKLPTLVPAAIDCINKIVEILSNPDTLSVLLDAAIEIITTLAVALAEQLPILIPKIAELVSNIAIEFTKEENLSKIIQAGFDIVSGIAQGIWNAVPELLGAIPQVIGQLIEQFPVLATLLAGVTAAIIAFNAASIAQKIATVATTVATTAQAAAQWLLNAALNANPIGIVILAITALVAAFVALWNYCEPFKQFWIDLWEGIKNAVSAAWDWISGVFDSIGEWFSGLWDKFKNIGSDLIKGLWEGISNMGQWIKDKIAGFGDDILSGIKDFFGIHSPSTLFRDEVGKMLVKGIGVGFDKEMPSLEKSINKDLLNLENGLNTDFAINATASGGGFGAFGGVSGKSVNVVQNIYSEAKSAADLMIEALYQQEMAVMMGV